MTIFGYEDILERERKEREQRRGYLRWLPQPVVSQAPTPQPVVSQPVVSPPVETTTKKSIPQQPAPSWIQSWGEMRQQAPAWQRTLATVIPPLGTFAAPYTEAPVKRGFEAVGKVVEAIEKPYSAAIWSQWKQGLRAFQGQPPPSLAEYFRETLLPMTVIGGYIPGEAQRKRLEAYEKEVPEWGKFLLGATHPMWWISGSIAAKAVGGVARAAKMTRLASAAEKVAVGITEAERIAALPLTAPLEALGKRVATKVAARGVTEAVPLINERVGMLPEPEKFAALLAREGSRQRVAADLFGKLPGGKRLVAIIDKAITTKTPMESAEVLRMAMQDPKASMVFLSTRRAVAVMPLEPIKMAEGLIADPRILQIAETPTGWSMAWNDVLEWNAKNPDKYYKIADEIKPFMNELGELGKAIEAYIEKIGGLGIKRARGEDTWTYFHRVVIAIQNERMPEFAEKLANELARAKIPFTRIEGETDVEFIARFMESAGKGEIQPTKEIDSLMNELGDLMDFNIRKQNITKPRKYLTVAEGLRAGVMYSEDPVVIAQQTLGLVYDKIIDRSAASLVKPLTNRRAELMTFANQGDEILYRNALDKADDLGSRANFASASERPALRAQQRIAIAEAKQYEPIVYQELTQARESLRVAKNTQAAINRAIRGERLPPATLNMIDNNLPDISQRLRSVLAKQVPNAIRLTPEEEVQMAYRILKNKLTAEGIDPGVIDVALKTYGFEPKLDRVGAVMTRENLQFKLQDSIGRENTIRQLTREILAKQFEVPTHEVDIILEGGSRVNPTLDIAEAKRYAERIAGLIKRGLPTRKEILSRLLPSSAEAIGIKGKGRNVALRGILTDVRNIVQKAQLASNQARFARTAAMRAVENKENIGRLVMIPTLSGRFVKSQDIALIGGTETWMKGTDIASAISKIYGTKPLGVIERMVQKVGQVGGVMRMSKASLDLSVQSIQLQGGLGFDVANLLMGKPTAVWWKSTIGSWRVAATRSLREAEIIDAKWWVSNPDRIPIAMEAARNQALIEPSEYFEMFGPISHWLERRGGIGKVANAAYKQTYGRAEVAFTVGGNRMGQLVRESMWDMAVKEGKVAELCRFSNLIRGVMSSRGMGISQFQRNLESGVIFFSPRFTRSCLTLLGHMIANPTSWTGRQAIKAISGLLAVNYGFFTMAALALGQDPKINPLPKSMGGDGADWLTIKIEGRRIGLGGILSDIRAGVTLVSEAIDDPENLLAFDESNPIFNRLRQKLAPPTAAVYEYLSGRDYIGEPVRGEGLLPSKETLTWAGKWGLPIWVESTIEEGASFPGTLAEFFGARTFPESLWTRYQNRVVDLVNANRSSLNSQFIELRGVRKTEVGWDDLSPEVIFGMERLYPELRDLKNAASSEMERRGWNPLTSQYFNQRAMARERRLGILTNVQRAWEEGRISGSQARQIIQDSGRDMRIAYQTIDQDPQYAEVKAELEQKYQDRAARAENKQWVVSSTYMRYWDIINDPDLYDELGVPRYEERERQLNELKQEVGDEVWGECQNWIDWERSDYPALVKTYYQSIEVLKPYWDIHDYVMQQYGLTELDAYYKAHPDEQATIRRYVGMYAQALRQISNIQEQMRLANPEIEEALTLFYR